MACSEVSCSNRPSKRFGLQFFRFPLGDPLRLLQWLHNMRRENWTPSRNSRLCSEHFEPHHFSTDTRGRPCLKDDAVPTVFSFSQHSEQQQRGRASRSDDVNPDRLPVYGADEEEGVDWLYEFPMDGLDDVDPDKNDLRGGVLGQSGEAEEAVVNIKEEPIDAAYASVLLPQTSTQTVKQETDPHQENLSISTLYSVRGGESTFVPPPAPPPAPVAQPVAIFISTSAGVLQPSVVPTPLRPIAPAPQPPPPQPPGPGNAIGCSGCSKVLLKGQTALQRKGSTQVFCSTVCLTGYLPPTSKARSCYQCLKEVAQPEDMIMSLNETAECIYFCSQFCLSVFSRKKKREVTQLEKKSKEELRISSVCSVKDEENTFDPPPGHGGTLEKDTVEHLRELLAQKTAELSASENHQEALQAENKTLLTNIANLKADMEVIKAENLNLIKENQTLREENQRLEGSYSKSQRGGEALMEEASAGFRELQAALEQRTGNVSVTPESPIPRTTSTPDSTLSQPEMSPLAPSSTFNNNILIMHQHPDVGLCEVGPDDHARIRQQSHGQVARFGCLLFKRVVSDENYRAWCKTTNWDGSRGKKELPQNIKNFVTEALKKEFPGMEVKDLKDCIYKINEFLRTPRKSSCGLTML